MSVTHGKNHQKSSNNTFFPPFICLARAKPTLQNARAVQSACSKHKTTTVPSDPKIAPDYEISSNFPPATSQRAAPLMQIRSAPRSASARHDYDPAKRLGRLRAPRHCQPPFGAGWALRSAPYPPSAQNPTPGAPSPCETSPAPAKLLQLPGKRPQLQTTAAKSWSSVNPGPNRSGSEVILHRGRKEK